MSISSRTRRRLETQGYTCPATADFEAVVPWLRFSPALCSVIGAVGTVLASPGILLSLAPFAALGALFSVHPFDLVYNHGIRRVTGTGPLPRNGAPRRFACGVATVWLVTTAAAFRTRSVLSGYVLGGSFVLVSGLVATTHVCIPSLVYRAMFRDPTE